MVTVLGWYGHTNVGDESYKETFPLLSPGLSFTFLNNIPPQTECKSFILGGGDIISPAYLDQMVNLKADKKLIISASATEKTPIPLLKQFDQIFVRDLFSERFLKSNGIDATFMPDISFMLNPDREAGQEYIENAFRSERLELRKTKIGIVVNAYLADCGGPHAAARDFMVFHRAAYDLARFMDNTDASFVFFPMCTAIPADDRITNGIVAQRCKFWNKNLMIHERLGVQGTLNLISSMDMVISSRLHSSIFSVIAGVPFLDITHHDKAKHFLETVSLESLGLSYWDVNQKGMTEAYERIIQSPEIKQDILSAYQSQMDVLQSEVKNVHLS